jgi:hypothetical protein
MSFQTGKIAETVEMKKSAFLTFHTRLGNKQKKRGKLTYSCTVLGLHSSQLFTPTQASQQHFP